MWINFTATFWFGQSFIVQEAEFSMHTGQSSSGNLTYCPKMLSIQCVSVFLSICPCSEQPTLELRLQTFLFQPRDPNNSSQLTLPKLVLMLPTSTSVIFSFSVLHIWSWRLSMASRAEAGGFTEALLSLADMTCRLSNIKTWFGSLTQQLVVVMSRLTHDHCSGLPT